MRMDVVRLELLGLTTPPEQPAVVFAPAARTRHDDRLVCPGEQADRIPTPRRMEDRPDEPNEAGKDDDAENDAEPR